MHNRGRTETTGKGQEPVPTSAAQHDKFKDLMALAIEPKRHRLGPQSFEKVIVKSDVDELEPNPTLGELLDVKIR